MITRTVVISNPCRVTCQKKQLVVQGDEKVLGTVPIEDIGILILDSYGIEVAQSLLVACAAGNVTVIVCDDYHMPSGIFQSTSGHSLHAKVIRAQSECAEPKKKRAWQLIIQAKIANQAAVLRICKKPFQQVQSLVPLVRSGDPDNVEGRAAQIYWTKLLGEDFIRDREAPDENGWLNYGYAILRAATARALVGTGLHLALGIHHRNQYNPDALADDVMEPFRPWVDLLVIGMMADQNLPESSFEITTATKKSLLKVLEMPVKFAGKSTPLLIALELYASHVKGILCESKKSLPSVTFI